MVASLIRNKFLLTIAAVLGAFCIVGIGLKSINLAILCLAVLLFVYAFYNPQQLIYVAFIIMFFNGYLRWQTGSSPLIAISLDIIVICLYLKFLFDLFFQKKLNFIMQIPLALPLVLFVVYCLLRVFAYDVPILQSIIGFRLMTFYMGLYFVGYLYCFDKKDFKKFILFCLVMVTALCLYACKQYFLGLTPIEDSWIRSVPATSFIDTDTVKIFSLQPTSQDFATLLALFIVLFLPFTVDSKSSKQNVVFIYSLIFIMLTSILSFIRGALVAWWLAAFVELFLLLKCKVIKPVNIFKGLITTVLICLILLLTMSTVTVGNKRLSVLVSRVQSIGSVPSLLGVTQQSTRARNEMFSMYERLAIWRNIITNTRNIIIGNGMGSLKQGTENFVSLNKQNVDNGFLRIYSELGLIGIALYLWILSGFCFFFYTRREINPVLCIALIGMTICFFVINLTSEYYELTPLKLNFWFFMGLGVRRLVEEKNARPVLAEEDGECQN